MVEEQIHTLTSEMAQLKMDRQADATLIADMQEFNRHLLRRLEERGVDLASERRLEIISDSMNARMKV